MTVAERSFILIDESSDRITLNNQLEKMLREKMQPILWLRDGLFCVIPMQIIQNLLNQIDDYIKGGRIGKLKLYINWSQGKFISHDITHFLIGIDCSIDDIGTNNRG